MYLYLLLRKYKFDFPQYRASQVMLVVKNPPASAGDTRDLGSIPGLGRSPGVGNGNPLQCSYLENSMDRGAWWAPVHEVENSGTWLRDWTWYLGAQYVLLVIWIYFLKVLFMNQDFPRKSRSRKEEKVHNCRPFLYLPDSQEEAWAWSLRFGLMSGSITYQLRSRPLCKSFLWSIKW